MRPCAADGGPATGITSGAARSIHQRGLSPRRKVGMMLTLRILIPSGLGRYPTVRITALGSSSVCPSASIAAWDVLSSIDVLTRLYWRRGFIFFTQSKMVRRLPNLRNRRFRLLSSRGSAKPSSRFVSAARIWSFAVQAVVLGEKITPFGSSTELRWPSLAPPPKSVLSQPVKRRRRRFAPML